MDKKQYAKEYYEKNKEKIKESQKEYRKEYDQRLEVIQRRKEWQKKYREKNKDNRKEYYKKNRKSILKKYRVYDKKRMATKEWKDYHKKYYENNKEYFKEYMAGVHIEEKRKVFEHYGNKCVLCGQDNKDFLTIDHINGGGNEHRKEVGSNIYYWLVKNDFPEGFRVLCYNCNCIAIKNNKGRLKKINKSLYHQKAREINKNYREKTKKQVFDYYGWRCFKCGQDNKDFLTIDHINGNGTNHIRKICKGHFYPWLIKNGFPSDFQTLCFNCNYSKARIKIIADGRMVTAVGK
jgi:hypothetical protein